MRTFAVVVLSKGFQTDTRLDERAKQLHIQAFIAHRSVEALIFAILPRTPWINVECRGE